MVLYDGTYRKGGRVEAWCQAMDRVEEARCAAWRQWIMPEGGRDIASCYTMERTGRAEESKSGAKRMDRVGRRERRGVVTSDGSCRK
ncbi:hypothetical protein ACFQ88_19795 [Paenibacillus sp. NPDC056579]|uniref:hypothetical protein n=1 Tax=Paenibacillus sp. NPDC056579 TaxID=3345871 RepID=UPI00369CF2E3